MIGNFGWALQRASRYNDARPYLLRAAAYFDSMGFTDEAERHRHAAEESA